MILRILILILKVTVEKVTTIPEKFKRIRVFIIFAGQVNPFSGSLLFGHVLVQWPLKSHLLSHYGPIFFALSRLLFSAELFTWPWHRRQGCRFWRFPVANEFFIPPLFLLSNDSRLQFLGKHRPTNWPHPIFGHSSAHFPTLSIDHFEVSQLAIFVLTAQRTSCFLRRPPPSVMRKRTDARAGFGLGHHLANVHLVKLRDLKMLLFGR